MARVDFYRVLGVSRDASDDAIKKAYRKLVLQHHPDRNPDSTHAEPKIREINAAYEVVGDPDKRRSYDRLIWGDETARDEAADPAVILDEMKKKLFDEGRKEVFAVLMKDVKRIKRKQYPLAYRVGRAIGRRARHEATIPRKACCRGRPRTCSAKAEDQPSGRSA